MIVSWRLVIAQNLMHLSESEQFYTYMLNYFDNSLFINVTKTEAMLFGTAQRLSNADSFDIHIDGKQIK